MVVLLVFVSVSCIASESSWSTKENSSDSMRQIIGLPSIAVGNLNPSARNPGLETILYLNFGFSRWILLLLDSRECHTSILQYPET